MAKSILNTNITALLPKVVTDFEPSKQPEGTQPFVLNSISGSRDGDEETRSNEEGNTPCGTFTPGYVLIGNRYTNDGRNIVFLCSLDETHGEIGIVDKNCVYTPKVNTTKFGFKLNKQIQATYRLRRGCEDVVYFTDNLNSMRDFNFSKPQDYYTDTYQAFLNQTSTTTFTGEIWDISKFDLFASYKVPCFSKLEVTTGGSIIPGTLNFDIRLLDNDLNPTNWIYSSQLVSIFQDSVDSNYDSIGGSSYVVSDDIAGINATNKAVKITLGSLDTHYKYYQIAVIEAHNSNGTVSRVLLSPSYPITSTEYIYDGNLEGYSDITKEELLIGKTDIDTVNHIEQFENRLILGNITGKQVPYCSFQKFASKIASNYITKELLYTDASIAGNPKNPNTYWEAESYMGDEVYAMGIVYVFNSGLETPTFHIPGRSRNKYRNVDTKTVVSTDDQTIINSWVQDLNPWYDTADSYNALPTSQKLKKWQVYDTSVKYSDSLLDESYGAMSYFENKNSFYTNIDDCQGDDYWGSDACGVPLRDLPIRHHKFPSRALEQHIRKGDIFTGKTGLYLDIALNSEQTFQPLTISINYEVNGVPGTYDYTISEDDLPIQRFQIAISDDDFNSIVIDSVTSTITDGANSAIYTYNVYRDVAVSASSNGVKIRLLGIQFSNIEYPHPDIVGHYFVRGARDNQNRTILDKGYCCRARKQPVNGVTYNSFSYMNGFTFSPTTNNWLFTPRFLFNKEALVGDYLKIENRPNLNTNYITTNKEDGKGSVFSEVDTVIEGRYRIYDGLRFDGAQSNFKVTKSVILDALAKNTTFEGPNDPLYNLSWSNRVHIVKTSVEFQSNVGASSQDNVQYVSYKVDRNVHPVLSEIVYQRIHNCQLGLNNTNKVFGGDVFISRFDIANSLYRTQKKGVFKTILSAILIAAAVVATIYTAGGAAATIAAAVGAASAAGIEAAIIVTALVAGSIGVTASAIQVISQEIDGDLSNMTYDSQMANATGTGWSLSSYIAYSNEMYTEMFVESEVNIGLRQQENHTCGAYYKFVGTTYEYFRSRWLYFDQKTNKWTPKGFCCPETYHYNKDFSRQNTQSVYFPLPNTYDCCSNCLESHPNRIQWSEQSFQEELTDNYKTFKANNYVDIEAEHGPITNIIKRNNNLLVNTSEAFWLLPQNNQERANTDLITFIGTGDFFGIPLKKVIDNEIGAAGTQHKWATINLTEGLLIVNEIAHKIYIFDGQFKELSSSEFGNAKWFKNNLIDNFARQFKKITGITFPNINNPANSFGVGIHSTYDSFNERFIITKRDYVLLSQHIDNFITVKSVNGVMPTGIELGQLVFDLTLSKFIIGGTSTTNYGVVDFNSTAYFENKSWTFSFSLKDKSWTSWHSYIPNFYMYTHDELYSFITSSNSIWKHNIPGLYQSYYGISYPYIVEVVLNTDAQTTKYWDDVSWKTIAKRKNSTTNSSYEEPFITYNKILAYNSRQTTGEQVLKVKNDITDTDYLSDQVQETAGIITINRVEEDWNTNDFRDYRSEYNSPIFLKNWDALKQSYFIDKLVDTTKIDFGKDWNDLEVLRDQFIILRFKFDNFTDVQLVTKYITDTSGISMR